MENIRQRFAIRRDTLIKPLLLPFGGTASGSFVELREGKLRLRFGPMFDRTLSLSEVESVSLSRWPPLGGLGWRTDFRGRIALVGSFRGVAEIKLREKQRIKFVLPFVHLRCNRIAVSLEEPEAFVTALQTALGRED